MSASLYVDDDSYFEIGKYGMTLQEAKKQFLETAELCGCTDFRVFEEIETEITFQFSFRHLDSLRNLLYAVANVGDLRGDPPFRYILKLNIEVPHQYTRTGSYSN